MSYSFQVKAANQVEAKEKVAAKLAEVLANQPIHSYDIQQAKAAVFAFVDLVPEVPGKHLQVNVHGSVGWQGAYPADYAINGASVGVGVYHVLPEA